MAAMSATLVAIPPEDACIVARLSRILAKRLVHGNDGPEQRQGLMRALLGLQRLPVLTADLVISISAGRCQLEIDPDHFGFVSYTEDWHTEFRIQYFSRSSHCIVGFDTLEGSERLEATNCRLDNFEAAMDEPDGISIEDLSTAGVVDEPPIDDFLDYARSYDES
jgi:hypothetical protein